MADRSAYLQALRAADAAGNAEDATRLAGIIQRMDAAPTETIGSQAKAGFIEGLEGIMKGLGETEAAMMVPGGRGMEVQEYVRDNFPVSQFLEPQTGGQRFARRASKTVGGSLPFMGLGPAAAGAKAVIPELIGAGLSAAGAGTVAAVAPGHPGAEIAAELLTPMAPAVIARGAIPTIWRSGKGLYNEFFDPETNYKAAEKSISEAMGRKLGPEERAAAEQAAALQEKIPGFKPSLPEALHETPAASDLLATQRSMEAAMPAEQRAAARQRYDDNLKAIRDYADTHAPGDPVEPQQVIDDISGKITDLRGPNDKGLLDVEREQLQLGAKLPQTGQMQHGQFLRERQNDLRTAEMQRMSEEADRLGLNNSQVGMPFGDFKAQMVNKYGLQRGEVPGNQPDILNVIAKDESPNITFNDLMRYRTSIDGSLRKAIFDKNDLMARKLSGMMHDVDDYILKGSSQSTDPNISAAYDTFRSQYKVDVIDRFKQGSAYRVRQKNGEGFYITPDEKVASLFWKSPTGAKQFKTTFREDPDATAALKDAVLDDLRQSTLRDGKISQPLFDTWYRKNKASLDQLPEIHVEVKNVKDASRSLTERAAVLDARNTAINDQILVKRLEKFSKGDLQPQQLATEAINNPRMMGQVLNTIGADTGARQAWNRLLWNQVSDASPETLEGMLTNPSVKMALGPQHTRYLEDIVSATKMAKSAGKMPGSDITPDLYAGVKNNFGQSVDSLVAKLWAAETGRTGLVWSATNIGGGIFRKQRKNAVTRVLKEAFYNPQVAKAMSESLRDTSPVAPSNLKMRAYLFNAGLDLAHEAEDDESSLNNTAPVPVVPDSEDNVYARR